MPDYASILRRSVSALPDPSSDMRQAVYQRARAALARQLTAVDPPLSTREIETQHQELEDAVVRLEAEFAPAEEPAPAFAEPPRRDDFLYSSPQTSAAERAPAPQPMPEYTRAASAPAAREFEEEDDEFEEEEERSSRIPLLVGLLAVLLVVIGAGAFLYMQRDTVLSFLSSDGTEQNAAAVDTPASPALSQSETADTEKAVDRLTNGTEAPAEAPAAEVPAAEAVAVAPSETPVPAETEEAAPLESLSGLGEEAAAPEESGTSLVEQKAIYYFQGKEGEAGQAVEGTATWAEIAKEGRPAIQTTIRIPERNVTVLVTIYKNYDEALPASHLVEVQFAGKISESPIQRVPALVLKQTEQARGQPLAGAAVPVTNELFWIALSDDQDEITRNIQLLREGSWFDIPILFGDQTRALITFEKGIPGDKVFETVMASWTPA
jgi:hypothetical protein